jgi:hypothetical protein
MTTTKNIKGTPQSNMLFARLGSAFFRSLRLASVGVSRKHGGFPDIVKTCGAREGVREVNVETGARGE